MKKKLKTKLSKEEVCNQLTEQLSFLIASSKLYDEGNHGEAKRLALCLRILFHDTRSSKSLLGQLHLKNIEWIDTATPYDPANLANHIGLISIRFDNPSGRVPWLTPKGTPEDRLRKKAFIKWWNHPVIVAIYKSKKKYFSRQNLILNIANTDGGGHVDPEIEADFWDLSRGNIIGLTAIQGGKEHPMIAPELPSIRQIAHEVLITLRKEAPQYFEKEYDEKVDSRPYGISCKTGPAMETEVKVHVNW